MSAVDVLDFGRRDTEPNSILHRVAGRGRCTADRHYSYDAVPTDGSPRTGRGCKGTSCAEVWNYIPEALRWTSCNRGFTGEPFNSIRCRAAGTLATAAGVITIAGGALTAMVESRYQCRLLLIAHQNLVESWTSRQSRSLCQNTEGQHANSTEPG